MNEAIRAHVLAEEHAALVEAVRSGKARGDGTFGRLRSLVRAVTIESDEHQTGAA